MPEKSFIRWAVEQGHTVFVISWVNPDEPLADKSFEDYMREGLFKALDAIGGDRRERPQRAWLLCRRHAALGEPRVHGGDRRHADEERDVPNDAGRLQARRRPESLLGRGPDQGDRARNGGARLSRQQQDGDDLQPPALERPDLAVHRQRLSEGQGAPALRSAVLELRRDAHAGRQSQLLPAPLLSPERPRRGADGVRRHAFSICRR